MQCPECQDNMVKDVLGEVINENDYYLICECINADCRCKWKEHIIIDIIEIGNYAEKRKRIEQSIKEDFPDENSDT